MPDLQFVLDRVRVRFPRMTDELEAMLAEDIIGTHIPDVCRHYPWWFLDGGSVGGGSALTSAFPLSDSDISSWSFPFEQWMDRGWLLLDEGVDTYVVGDTALPGEGDQDPATWAPVLVRSLRTARRYHLDGSRETLMESLKPDQFRDLATYEDGRYGEPCRITVMEEYVNGDRVSVIKVNPVPDKCYLVQVDFRLQIPPTISTGVGPNDKTNIVIETYPELAINLAMLAAAEYFNEARAMQYYEQKLWGTPLKGSISRAAQKDGIIGRMKRDDKIRKQQRERSIEYRLGNPWSPNRRPGRSNFRRSFYGRYRY